MLNFLYERRYYQRISTDPQEDLHVHLDGSLRIPTLIELAKAQNVNLPSYEEQGLRETVFKESYNDLPDYRRASRICSNKDPESVER